ncbi:uncharacterized protein N7473_006949 [Penicillium subrubescens]|uniref:uncharacterized protein n=1 Tax=Penicillium subrubescens TaxID=1316194 RepID=UPI002545113F|nr:uncharacterized protein N7473_006949 [Penicillium subrubescens]KAJ5890721.1 hypothetical protein N7473_006949 [Penicillium subrubescens]
MTCLNIPPSFLQNLPPNATIHPLDFTQTTPPIPAYKNHFAAVIDNFLTPTECTQLLQLAGESAHPPTTTTTTTATNNLSTSSLLEPTWQRALVNAGSGTQVLSSTRKSSRYILDSPEIASRLLARLTPFLSSFGLTRIEKQPLITGLGPAKRGEVFVLAGLNERMRFLRYDGGDYFRPHWDGCYIRDCDGEGGGEGGEKSFDGGCIFLRGEDGMVDLRGVAEGNGDGGDGDGDGKESGSGIGSGSGREQETLLGGATSFGDDYRMRDSVRVFPKTGSLLVFQQRNLMHSGDDVFRGVKYTVRTDVMYALEKQEESREEA